MKALVLLANGFEEVEGITQIDFLRRGGVEVVSASIHDSKKITGAHDIHIGADETLAIQMNLILLYCLAVMAE